MVKIIYVQKNILYMILFINLLACCHDLSIEAASCLY